MYALNLIFNQLLRAREKPVVPSALGSRRMIPGTLIKPSPWRASGRAP